MYSYIFLVVGKILWTDGCQAFPEFDVVFNNFCIMILACILVIT